MMHGRTLDTERFGVVTLHVLPAVSARRALRRMVEAALRESLSKMSEGAECVVAWTGTRPGPSWDILDELGRRHRPVAQRGSTLYVVGPSAHTLSTERESRPKMHGERKRAERRVGES